MIEVIRALDFSPFHLRIRGVAGGGKSLAAQQLFNETEREGKRALYICFNRPLRDKMSATLDPSIGVVETFHGLCVNTLKKHSMAPDFTKMASNPNFWDDIVNDVIALDIQDSEQFDRVIVDEGQDFKQLWLDVLGLFYTDQSDLIWMDDQHQNVSVNPTVAPEVGVTYTLNKSYRSPQSIARFIKSSHQIDFESLNAHEGLGVGVHQYNDESEKISLLVGCIDTLVSQGFKLDEIVVLTCSGLDSAELHTRDAVGPYKIKKFTKKYDHNNNPVYTNGELLVDSVHRFKGGQSELARVSRTVKLSHHPILVFNLYWRLVVHCLMDSFSVVVNLYKLEDS